MKYQPPICALLLALLFSVALVLSRLGPGGLPRPDCVSPLRNRLLLSRRRRRLRFQVSDKPVARVNGTVLTDRDLLREMFAIFPYAKQHNGFPKAQEASIRQGALK
jgi:hypothetical protein